MSERIREGDIPGVQLRCRGDLPLPAERVWPLLTSRAEQAGWLAVEAAVDDDGRVVWVGNGEFDGAVREQVDVVEAAAPGRWVVRLRQPEWPAATRLEIELAPTVGGCSVSILQNGFEQLPLSISLTVWEAYRRHWRASIERLRARCRTG